MKKNSLADFSDDELVLELERRKKEQVPIQLKTPVLGNLQILCEKFIIAVQNNDENDADNFQHYIFEVAVEAFYGKDVWKWVNKQQTK